MDKLAIWDTSPAMISVDAYHSKMEWVKKTAAQF